MALVSDAAMVLFYDFEGDSADHDAWHSAEHFHERLSVPGFLRATRWKAVDAAPLYMVTYEVSGTGIATSQPYLDRLNDPTPWTRAVMPRFRGMIRGFCHIAASAGFGMGSHALVLRFEPEKGARDRVRTRLADDLLPALAARPGLVGAHLLEPAPPPPMTREQALRGRDGVMPWLLIATAHEAAALRDLAGGPLDPARFAAAAECTGATAGLYAQHHTATAGEVARSPAPQGPSDHNGG